MNLIKTLILLLLNLEIALGAESVQISDSHTVQEPASQVRISKRNSAYKRLPGWRVYYGKRSSETDLGDKKEYISLSDTQDINELLDREVDDLHTTSSESIDTTDISESDNLSNAVYTGSKDEGLAGLESDYKIDFPSANIQDAMRELLQQYNIQRTNADISDYKKEELVNLPEQKRSGWNPIYGKRMPGWRATYGKRSDDWNDLTEKRAPGWIATYGKRAPGWFATYGKRAPQWLATYGKRAPQWLATYGKRAPQWLATYGKRAPQWLATYGKRAPQWLATYGKRAPKWLATYGKRAPQWLATYGKRAPGWLPFYGKRTDSTYDDASFSDSDKLQSSETNELVNSMPKRLPGWNVGYGKRGNRGWSALYG